jgi:DNA repair protein RecN (Recombination protein N)
LHVAGLGVIDDSTVAFGEGLTALTGETGAGKTLLVDALALVMGGRPARGLVQTGRDALIEAHFLDERGDEVILAREIPSSGRARAWIDGRMATVSSLVERSAGLCDIHGQHEHQSLLDHGAFRRALDHFAGIDIEPLASARRTIAALERERTALGGTSEEIERERGLLEFQINEIASAGLSDPDEIDRLLEAAQLLEAAESLKAILSEAVDTLDGESGDTPRDVISTLQRSIQAYESFGDLSRSLVTVGALLGDLVSDLRRANESIEQDPEALERTNERLKALHHLCRRYGPTLEDVMSRGREFEAQLDALNQAESSRSTLVDRMQIAQGEVDRISEEILRKRAASAPAMTSALLERLASLALGSARIELEISGEAGDDVQMLFSANPGLPLAPVASVASGGELARLMLAIRLTLPGGPPTMVFDEVDTGIGGATAVALARALQGVAATRQVLVVTHLAQVAAAADQQISVIKEARGRSTLARAMQLTGEDRITEVARMLSGQPDSQNARRHAEEMLRR